MHHCSKVIFPGIRVRKSEKLLVEILIESQSLSAAVGTCNSDERVDIDKDIVKKVDIRQRWRITINVLSDNW